MCICLFLEHILFIHEQKTISNIILKYARIMSSNASYTNTHIMHFCIFSCLNFNIHNTYYDQYLHTNNLYMHTFVPFLILTLSLPITIKVPYANSLDSVETPSNSAFHLDPSCLTLRNIFNNFELHFITLKIKSDNLFGRLRVKST